MSSQNNRVAHLIRSKGSTDCDTVFACPAQLDRWLDVHYLISASSLTEDIAAIWLPIQDHVISHQNDPHTPFYKLIECWLLPRLQSRPEKEPGTFVMWALSAQKVSIRAVAEMHFFLTTSGWNAIVQILAKIVSNEEMLLHVIMHNLTRARRTHPSSRLIHPMICKIASIG